MPKNSERVYLAKIAELKRKIALEIAERRRLHRRVKKITGFLDKKKSRKFRPTFKTKTKVVFKPKFKHELKTENENGSRRRLRLQFQLNNNENGFQLNNTFAKGYLRSWVLEGREQDRDLIRFFETFEQKIVQKLREEISDLSSIKYQICVKLKMQKEDLTSFPFFRSKQNVVMDLGNISSSLSQAQQKIQECLEKWTQNGSGWVLQQIDRMYIDVAKYNPLKGGSYIKTPRYYMLKRAIINVQNKDDDCLRWALRSWKFPAENHPERPSSYCKNDGFNFNGISSPTPISEICRLEKMNTLAINVFGNNASNTGIIVHRNSSMPKEIPRVNLFLITKDGKCHYTWIKDFNRLLHDQTKYNGRKHFCERCLHGYSREEFLQRHKKDCEGIGETAIKTQMAGEANKDLYFKNFKNKMPAPYVIYADFESINTPIEVAHSNPENSYTIKTQKHEACSYGFIAIRSDGRIRGPFQYRGENAAELFLRALQIIEMEIRQELKELQKENILRMTPEDERRFQESDSCWICGKSDFIPKEAICNCPWPQLEQRKFEKEKCKICGKFSGKYENYNKVRDHCHITNRFRGAAHARCNSQLQIDPQKVKIPVILHNLRGYDSHLIMQAISKVEGDIKCIPNNMEKYISFSLGNLVFKDSFQFLLSGLDALVKANKPEDLKITAEFTSEEIRPLLLKKGVYPYNHIKSWDSFEETELPPIECFYNDLAEEHIRPTDYEHAQNVWRTLGCRTLGDYHDVYLLN